MAVAFGTVTFLFVMGKIGKHYYAVILAGGSGTRFWPLSRHRKPKQFLNITGEDCLFEKTVKRILPKFPPKNIYVVTNKLYRKDILRYARAFHIPSRNILFEPKGKNTAPAILWAAHLIHCKDPEAVMAVLPSDHLILNNQSFLKIVDEALGLAKQQYLVTLGITPTRPDTGYGYLETKKVRLNNKHILQVKRFTEKPNVEKAKRFIKAKNYFWNSGMFFWKTSTVLDEFRKHLPRNFFLMTQTRSPQNIEHIWPKLESISVDYGILERAKRVAAVEAKNIGWSDVGSWEALVGVLPKDDAKNIHRADVLGIESQNNLIFSKRFVATIGVEDLIIIDTDDALLVCRKNESQKVRHVVEKLKVKKQHLI